MKNGNIRIHCGIGDWISYCTRFKSFKETHQIDELHIQVIGGWKDIPDKIIEIAQPLKKHNEITSIGKYPLPFASIDENWQPDSASLKYKMELPYRYPTLVGDARYSKYLTKKTCVIQPQTSSGNFEGQILGRSLEPDKWKVIIDKLHEHDYQIIIVGDKNDKGFLQSGWVDMDLCGETTLLETIYILRNCGLNISINSWCWEVSAYSGIPTVCLYYTNYSIFCKIHTVNMDKPNHGIPNLIITESKNLPDIQSYIKEMMSYENR